jgi:hypothetical protein
MEYSKGNILSEKSSTFRKVFNNTEGTVNSMRRDVDGVFLLIIILSCILSSRQ